MIQRVWCAVSLHWASTRGAYVAEIVRGGLMSVNPGQMEAGRSLGLNYAQTMRLIVIPQAIKNILPALGNEMITLLKDTSLVSVIALRDVTSRHRILCPIPIRPMCRMSALRSSIWCSLSS